jgi:hypothetical protein
LRQYSCILANTTNNALKTLLEENETSSLQQFEISKMVSKTIRSLNNIGELMSDKAIGIIFTTNNLCYLMNKLSLLENTNYFKIRNLIGSDFDEGKDEKRFKSSLNGINDDIQNLMYSLARLIWEEASRYVLYILINFIIGVPSVGERVL